MGLAAIIEHNHKPDPDSGRMLMHQFLMRGSELAYGENDANQELTREELDTLEEHRRADGALGHSVLDSDDLQDVHLDRAGFVEDGINHHVHGYSIKETAFEQNSAAVDSTDGDENTVTGTGRLKLGIQDDSSAQAERKRAQRAARQLTQQELLRQELAALNARIDRLEKQKAQVDQNIEKLKEAREILADNELNADTDRGRALRERLRTIDTGLREDGVDIGVQTDSNGRIVNADEARNTAVQAQTQQEQESERLGRELDDARQERDEFLERHPEMRDERSAHFDDIAAARTEEETVAFDAGVSEINLETAAATQADAQRLLARVQPDNDSNLSAIQTARFVSSPNDLNAFNQVSAEGGAVDSANYTTMELMASLEDNPPAYDDINMMASLDSDLSSGDLTLMTSLDDEALSGGLDDITLMASLDEPRQSDLGNIELMASLDVGDDAQTLTAVSYTSDETIGSFAANGEESVITRQFNPISSGEAVQVAEATISSPDLESSPGSLVDGQQQNDQNNRLPVAAIA